jgi:23S rRNA (cytidine1920-2'-O)/16S rRNA (cytidine1409-2'-O)-methyltransferase
MKKERLDQHLVAAGHCESREMAKRLILAGEVMLGGHVADKPATPVPEGAEISIRQRPRFVGRGGLKLEAALQSFQIDVEGRIGLDIGASTGGFTDCLLQNGAAKVYAFDVGTNQLAWKIRNDPRVVAREKFNCRELQPTDLDDQPSIIVSDVSFISLTKILPAAAQVIAPGGEFVVLIKPQFELGRGQVGKGGIVRDPELHQIATDKIVTFATEELGLSSQGVIDSPIEGATGNREFLAWFNA